MTNATAEAILAFDFFLLGSHTHTHEHTNFETDTHTYRQLRNFKQSNWFFACDN
jgi:hypothetical protein